MHLEVYEAAWFICDLMIDTTLLHILSQIQDHRHARKENFWNWAKYLAKFLMDVGGIKYAVEICWYDESHALFSLCDQCSIRELYLGDFL